MDCLIRAFYLLWFERSGFIDLADGFNSLFFRQATSSPVFKSVWSLESLIGFLLVKMIFKKDRGFAPFYLPHYRFEVEIRFFPNLFECFHLSFPPEMEITSKGGNNRRYQTLPSQNTKRCAMRRKQEEFKAFIG